MRFTNLIRKIWKEEAKDAELESHKLLLRAGYIRQLASGIFSYLHLGQRSLKKIEQVLREEMDRIGGAEICMPVVHPADIWKKTNRWYEIDESLVRFHDRGERDMVLAMTHEEVVADLCRSEINSYKNLPKLVYQIYTKFRDEARARGGLIRVREFTMKDSYSLDTDWEGLEKQYIRHYDAYFRIAARTGLPLLAVESDTGMMGGRVAHEFMYVTPIGEDTVFLCKNCDYVANKEVAVFKKTFTQTDPLPLEKVYTPGAKTIADLVALMGDGADKFAKVIFLHGINKEEEEKVIVAVIRGDMELNYAKLQKAGGVSKLRAAGEAEIKEIGAVPGFASPIGVDRAKSLIIIDDYIAEQNNWVSGANEVDYHLKNVCYQRDFEADVVADIVSAFEGAGCASCDSGENVLESVRAVEVGNIFQLGTKYTKGMGAQYMDINGRMQDVIMGSYGIGVGRILACAIEEHHDENGIQLPIAIAPYQVILVALLDNEEVIETATTLYEQMKAAGVEVLFDDRDKKLAPPGVKFFDADLIGIPIRLTISKRSMKNGGVEFKLRREAEGTILAVDEVLPKVQENIALLFSEMNEVLEKAETWKG